MLSRLEGVDRNHSDVSFCCQPREIIFGAADEVLSELKRDDITERKKKTEVEGLLGGLEEDKYALLVGLGKKITDYGVDKRQIAAAEGKGVQSGDLPSV